MKFFAALMSLLLIPLVGLAAEIVAWKVPLSRLVGRGLEESGVVRCKSAPEASPFFKEGDELWDLKGVVPDDHEKFESSVDWLVWNATTARIVAKGNWADIWMIHDLLRVSDLPKNCRINVNLYEVAADGRAPADDAKPAATLSMLTRSGQKADATWSEAGKSIKVEMEPTVYEDGTRANIRFVCSVEVPDQARMEITTEFTLFSAKPLWVGRDFDGKKGLDLKADCGFESLDGIALRELVMIQQGDGTQCLTPDRQDTARHRAGEGWLTNIPLDRGSLMDWISSQDTPTKADPLAASQQINRPLPQMPSVKPPDFLHLDHEMLNAEKWFWKIANLSKGEGDLCFYDPIQERMYFYSKDEQVVDGIESMLTSMCNLPLPTRVVATLEGNGQMQLVARAGRNAILSRMVGESAVQRYLEINPTLGDSASIIDMRLFFEDRADPKAIKRLSSIATLTNGNPLELLSGFRADGGKSSLRLKAEVIRSGP